MRLTAEKIKRTRKALRETQEDFGQRFGSTQATVAHWEAGKQKPRYLATRELIKLFRAVCIDDEPNQENVKEELDGSR